MVIASAFVVCRGCECHTKRAHAACDHCGAALDAGAPAGRNASALALGLTVVLGATQMIACGTYGAAPTMGPGANPAPVSEEEIAPATTSTAPTAEPSATSVPAP